MKTQIIRKTDFSDKVKKLSVPEFRERMKSILRPDEIEFYIKELKLKGAGKPEKAETNLGDSK